MGLRIDNPGGWAVWFGGKEEHTVLSVDIDEKQTTIIVNGKVKGLREAWEKIAMLNRSAFFSLNQEARSVLKQIVLDTLGTSKEAHEAVGKRMEFLEAENARLSLTLDALQNAGGKLE